MKNLLQNLPMHRKLLLLLFFPSVLLLWFASQSLLLQWQHYQNAAQVRAAIGDHLLLGQLVNALQVERGSSGIFISSKGARFSAEVKKARSGSDEWLAALTGPQRAALSDLIQALPGLRSQIDSFSVDATASAAGYTKHISQLLQRNDQAVQTLTDLTLARQLATLNDWIELIERAGRERALVSLAFSQDQAEPALISRIAQNHGAFLVFSSRLQQHDAEIRLVVAVGFDGERDVRADPGSHGIGVVGVGVRRRYAAARAHHRAKVGAARGFAGTREQTAPRS